MLSLLPLAPFETAELTGLSRSDLDLYYCNKINYINLNTVTFIKSINVGLHINIFKA